MKNLETLGKNGRVGRYVSLQMSITLDEVSWGDFECIFT